MQANERYDTLPELDDEGASLGTSAVDDIERTWLDGAASYRRLTLAEEKKAATGQRVCACCADGRQALVCHNLLLIPDIAARYRLDNTSLDRVDVWQMGYEGLQKAAVRFEPARGVHFGTHATWWIRQAISRGVLDEGYTIREPAYVATERRKAKREKRTYAARLLPISLDRNVTNNHSGLYDSATHETLGQRLPDPHAINPENAAVATGEQRRLLEAMERTLTEREILVVTLRWGIFGADEHTGAEAGRAIGISRERVRQIELKAIGKLKVYYGTFGVAFESPRRNAKTMALSAVPASKPKSIPKKRQRPAHSVSAAATASETRQPSPTVQQTTSTLRRAPSRISQSVESSARVLPPAPSTEDKAMRLPASRGRLCSTNQQKTAPARSRRKAGA